MVNNEGNGFKGISLEELTEEFLKTGDEEYFNILWERVKPFSIRIGNKFMTIPYEDKESIAMEVLFRCIPKLQKGKGKLLTYYGFALTGEYICCLEKGNTYKQKINSEAYSLEKMEEDVGYIPSATQDDFNINLFLEDCNLLGIEIKMVLLIDEGYKKKEIMKMLKLKNEDYNNIHNTIKEKIKNNYLEESFN